MIPISIYGLGSALRDVFCRTGVVVIQFGLHCIIQLSSVLKFNEGMV